MSTPLLPSVRLPSILSSSGAGGDGDSTGADAVVLELPSSHKFGFAWPADSTMSLGQTISERHAMLASSDTETDMSTDGAPDDRHDDEGSDVEYTPTSRLHDPMESVLPHAAAPPLLPRLSRAFSMPVPSQLGHLKNPRRVSSSTSDDLRSPDVPYLHELSLELADSVQMVIQTLLQLSPPQVLDPAKEQFSACSLSIPTPSISAMFTSMKNLNYMSANMSAFSAPPSPKPVFGLPSPSSAQSLPDITTDESDFDIGEMLQSVGDALSGVAAEAGVDLVLYHADVGMKHVSVKGDECGVSYTISHVVRQVIGTAHPGDSIEIGLLVVPETPDSPRSDPLADSTDSLLSRAVDTGRLRCTFDIAHKFSAESARSDGSGSESRPTSPSPYRAEPLFNSVVLRTLLTHLDAAFMPNLLPKLFPVGRSCELTFTLAQGNHSAVNPSVVLSPNEPGLQGHPGLRIANEPTLEELTSFAETLKGKKVTLFSSSKGSFAHHLTSYLTAWGMDVSHISPETGEADSGEGLQDAATPVLSTSARGDAVLGASAQLTPPLGGMEGFPLPGQDPSMTKPPSSPLASQPVAPSPSFVFIDDDVLILRERLQKLRSEQGHVFNLQNRKRPSLAANHRPRSSPQVVRALGMIPQGSVPLPLVSTVIVHFTSLANYKLVKDVLQQAFSPSSGVPFSRIPEVIVIPKPAGPRRFLTALHTAVTKPVVDPYFAPIATSPMSPGIHSGSPFFNFSGPSPGTPSPKPPSTSRTNSDRSARSPKDPIADPLNNIPLPSPLSMSDGLEYFSDAAVKLGTSPSTGLVIQSPDGQPAGIFFHPKGRNSRGTLGGVALERDRPQQLLVTSERYERHRGPNTRRTSDPSANTPGGSGASSRRSTFLAEDSTGDAALSSPSGRGKTRKQSSPRMDDHPSPSIAALVTSQLPLATPVESSPTGIGHILGATPRGMSRKSSQTSDSARRLSSPPPMSPRADPGASAAPPRRARRQTSSKGATPSLTTPPAITLAKKGKVSADTNIVPPISVLIVDDNPINQTILSTFMKKKRIKYDVAKNGEEAVAKWRSGGFHLILMDIQMPIMDGIQATKEIRRMEKSYGTMGPATPQSDLMEQQSTPSDVASSTDSKNTPTSPYRSSVIIVALTASSLQSDRVAALAAGCNDFLTKPVSLQWLNSKIIEWGSIKALQMWADLRPEVVKSISNGQAMQAQNVARKLHVPEGRATPSGSGSRASSLTRKPAAVDAALAEVAADADKRVPSPLIAQVPVNDDSPPQPASDATATPQFPWDAPPSLGTIGSDDTITQATASHFGGLVVTEPTPILDPPAEEAAEKPAEKDPSVEGGPSPPGNHTPSD